MANSNGNSNHDSAFGRAFLPGLVLGLVIGGLCGAVLPDLLGGPKIHAPDPTAAPSTDRDRHAVSEQALIEQAEREAAELAEQAPPADTQPGPVATPDATPDQPSSTTPSTTP